MGSVYSTLQGHPLRVFVFQDFQIDQPSKSAALLPNHIVCSEGQGYRFGATANGW